ncbi:hypothetical protein ACFSTD_08525 [Novosphingobium colocasiae]|uniref:Uncharacterized protein n=1 Tax=Novosphingobium colocasiae TaxID=1256513 RepID=A0A918PDI3_9SPHN|nr:hypothetical protein [Novosphingobium colocasiae]GGZ01257.1 hypothetical protein GCM10011614_15160 [Novosphingobium colocasiae]
MSARLAAQVLADRAARDAARAAYDTRLEAIKADYAERGIGGRLMDEVSEQAHAMFDEAVAVVEEHPGAIGATIATLALWILRNPIMAWIDVLLGPGHHRGDKK